MVALALLAPSPRHTLVVGGDLMLNGIPPGRQPLRGVRGVVRAADFALANLEVPLTRAKTPTAAKSIAERAERSQFVLQADPRHVATLQGAGFDAVALGNNHTMDYGAAGLEEERAALRKAGIASAGAGKDAYDASGLALVTGRGGFRVGLLSALAFVGRPALRKCSPASRTAPGVNVLAFDGRIDALARAKLKRWVGGARARCDYLVVALHWGIERQTAPTAYQRALGRAVVLAGADLVWGAHPHVLQPRETFRGAPILYSTGNLVSALPGRSALYRLEIGPHATARTTTIDVRIADGRASIIPEKTQRTSPGRIIP